MTLRLVIDVSLSPEWVPVLINAGFEAVHWAAIGDPAAPDREIMDWAVANDWAVFSHDLDFSTMLALTEAGRPSLIQLRGPSVLPEQIAELLIQSLHRFRPDLEAGAPLLIEPGRSRVRVLPL
jgi:predicted nuclease of predicted toxin-antitoxin system